MKQSLRLRRGESERRTPSPRETGLAAAVGLAVEVERAEPGDTGRVCSHCGTEGRLDMVDTTIRRAFLTCPSCGHIWDTAKLDQITAG